jgi:hypothetical protein
MHPFMIHAMADLITGDFDMKMQHTFTFTEMA